MSEGRRSSRARPKSRWSATWVQHLATVPDAAVNVARARLAVVKPAVSHEVGLRRLTHSQYNNTVRDLIGDYSRPADRFPPEDFVGGFKNQTRSQGIPPVLEDAYSRAAERMALNAFRAGDVNNLIPCKPASARDAKCREQFVRAFGERAFRRPLTSVEVRRYTDLFATQAAKAGKFLEGARVVVEAMLQSPKFLFHVTAGDPSVRLAGHYRRGNGSVRLQADLRDYAIANRLSYFLWDTMPDRALLDAAANGELRTSDGIERVGRTMLEDTRARQAVDEFFSQWLRFDRMLRRGQGRWPVSVVHAGARGDDGAGNEDAPGPPRLERSQLHGSAHRGLQLPQCRPCAPVRAAGARRRIRDGEISGRSFRAPAFSDRRPSSRRQPVRSKRRPPRAACSCASTCSVRSCRILRRA